MAMRRDLVCLDRKGGPSDGYSSDAALAPGGRSIAFDSLATDLVWGDRNDQGDVFLRPVP
jgi:hypothetical protein